MLETPYKARCAADIWGMYNRDRDMEAGNIRYVFRDRDVVAGIFRTDRGMVAAIHLISFILASMSRSNLPPPSHKNEVFFPAKILTFGCYSQPLSSRFIPLCCVQIKSWIKAENATHVWIVTGLIHLYLPNVIWLSASISLSISYIPGFHVYTKRNKTTG